MELLIHISIYHQVILRICHEYSLLVSSILDLVQVIDQWLNKHFQAENIQNQIDLQCIM